MTDPIADMLTRIRNAIAANHPRVDIPGSKLKMEVARILKEEGYTQAETSKVLGIKQPEVSALMCARFHRFSQERLIGFLNKLNLKVTIQISAHQRGEPFQQVSIAL